MAHGGARPGAGRPKGSENEDTKLRREMKQRWLRKVHKVADEIFDTHLEQARGVYREVVTPKGKIRVYKTPPNPMSLEWIMQHIWGMAPLKIDLDADISTEEMRPIHPEHYASILTVMQNWGIVKPEQAKEVADKYEHPPDSPAPEDVTAAANAPAADVDVPGSGGGDIEKH